MIFVGIDVAKDKHDCFITNSDGEVLFQSFTIANNLFGFDDLYQKVVSVMENVSKVKVGLEATGHYSYNLLGYLFDKGFPTYIINPLHTNLYRKSLSLRQTKTDKVDARTIASMLMSDVNLKSYSDTSYHNEELKSLTRYRFDKVPKMKFSIPPPLGAVAFTSAQLIFTLSYIHGMVISPSDSSRRRFMMSKYIPGNQKHLTLENRIYIENELNKGTSFKDIARFLCKDPTTISKEVRAHRLSDWYHKGTFYNARFADRKYREKLQDSRTGINMTKRELRKKDQIISPLIEQGQSPYHILANHPELDMSVRTLYSYLDQGLFTARNIDLKRKVHFKPRKCHKTQITDRAVFSNRLYHDFCSLALTGYVQMDTVHSSRESKKTLLTMFFTKEKLFLAFLMNRCTKGAVRLVFDRLEKRMGTYEFASVFEYILTDRGSEFGDPDALETGVNGIQRSSIYYCDPMQSGQKGGLEQAHRHIRCSG